MASGAAYQDISESQAKAPVANQSWWARLSGRKKLLIAGVVGILVVGLAVGLGVGLTVGRGGDDDDNGDDGGSHATSTSTYTPVPPTSTPTAVWQPSVNQSWQIILLKPIDLATDAQSVTPDVDIFDIDLWDTPVSTIETLHRLGKKVICYFSAGTSENWRSDFNQFKSEDIGKALPEWEGEKWLKLSSENVRKIMATRINMAANKGCDAIDPDNVDGFDNDNGLGLKESDSVDFMKYLATEARKYNLAIGLKNAAAIIPDVLNVTQFCVNEQCVENEECDTFAPFVQDKKPVFHIEYPNGAPSISAATRQSFCSGKDKAAGSTGFSTLLKKMNLDGWTEFCNGTIIETPLNTTFSSH